MIRCCFTFLSLILSISLVAQNDIDFDFSYDVQQVFEPLSLARADVTKAETILDLNQYYKPSWVKEFISVEVTSTTNSEVKSASSGTDKLSEDQKAIINNADIGAYINVKMDYIPENNLKNNEPKVFEFAFRVNPEQSAKFEAGEEQMLGHLKKAAFDKIALNKFRQYHLTAVKFTIDEFGQVTNAHVFESSKDEEVDALMLNAVCSMPDWTPAKYADGTSTSQEFVLRAGDMSSCVVNLLDTRTQ